MKKIKEVVKLNYSLIWILTESDNKKLDVKSQLDHQIQIQETKDSGWIFDKIISMRIRFYRACEINGSSYVKNILRSNVISNIRKIDKCCLLWSILVYSHPCKNSHFNRVSNYRQHFDEL